jgi:hypothetical protein
MAKPPDDHFENDVGEPRDVSAMHSPEMVSFLKALSDRIKQNRAGRQAPPPPPSAPHGRTA